ncbi:hypothetical protein ACTXT7_008529 [Hymenolepis weldensis]
MNAKFCCKLSRHCPGATAISYPQQSAHLQLTLPHAANSSSQLLLSATATIPTNNRHLQLQHSLYLFPQLLIKAFYLLNAPCTFTSSKP